MRRTTLSGLLALGAVACAAGGPLAGTSHAMAGSIQMQAMNQAAMQAASLQQAQVVLAQAQRDAAARRVNRTASVQQLLASVETITGTRTGTPQASDPRATVAISAYL